MSRKLTHSLRALGIALSLLTAGLIAGTPAPGPTETFAGRNASVLSTETRTEATQTPARTYKRNRRAQAREAMALPFFSFAQGLRRGNGS